MRPSNCLAAFGCLNVNGFTVGKHKRKPFLNPYRSQSDFKLKVVTRICVYNLILLPHFDRSLAVVRR